jgi:ABC-2 type transport system permease protein
MAAKMRWWVIARQGIRTALKKKSIWVFTAISGWYYLGMMFTLYVLEQMSQRAASMGQPSPLANFISRIVWKDQFLHGLSFGQIMYVIVALIIGAGAIANDNRANALLVYLSKPCTKLDYLIGKWVGIFIPLLMVMSIPSIMFFAYGALTYRQDGFFYQDYWLFPKLIAVLILGAAVHTSLIVGFSSLFNQGRLAGATYAGLYFLTNFFTQLMVFSWRMVTDAGAGQGTDLGKAAVAKLFYGSIDGLNIGMAKAVLRTDGSPYFGAPSEMPMVPAPGFLPMIVIVVLVCAASMFIAWTRIRAVEVVG